MLLTIETTRRPATDLGYLIRKNPARFQEVNLNFGKAFVFYPVVREDLCRVALLLEIDPIELIRGKGGGASHGLMDQYVNDRPYAASSFLSVALGQVFGSAMKGACKEKPGLEMEKIPLCAKLPALKSHGGEGTIKKLFEPLGYLVEVEPQMMDAGSPEWGTGPYYSVSISSTTTLMEMLNHLYVLIPSLDDAKHYYVGDDEVKKLLAKGKGWLKEHPEKEFIAYRYLRRKKSLARMAMDRLTVEEGRGDETASPDPVDQDKDERGIPLYEHRTGAVLAALASFGARRVIDIGCGDGKLLAALMKDRRYERIVGMDVSTRALEVAARRLRLDAMPPTQRMRIDLIHGSLMYRDARLGGFDAATVVEVIEHLDPPRLRAFERVLFEFASPGMVALTTPNVEYNVRFENMREGAMRHGDHRFEWTRPEFEQWVELISAKYGYQFRILPVGPEDQQVGSPTQMAIFQK